MKLNQSDKYPTEEFCNQKRQEFLTWLKNGATGPNPIPFMPELQEEFEFVPKVEEPKPEPTQEEINQKRIGEIKSELMTIDQKSIRALREGDQERLQSYEDEAGILRDELAGLIEQLPDNLS